MHVQKKITEDYVMTIGRIRTPEESRKWFQENMGRGGAIPFGTRFTMDKNEIAPVTTETDATEPSEASTSKYRKKWMDFIDSYEPEDNGAPPSRERLEASLYGWIDNLGGVKNGGETLRKILELSNKVLVDRGEEPLTLPEE